MGYAAVNTYENNGLPPMSDTRKINMLVNAKGKVCLVYDEPFDGVPLWVKYRKPSRKIDLLFDNGATMTLKNDVPDQLDSYLINCNRVTIVRIEDQKPVEGWETILLNELI